MVDNNPEDLQAIIAREEARLTEHASPEHVEDDYIIEYDQ